MSDSSQGPGWWVASDGVWYPPEQHPDYRGEPATPEPALHEDDDRERRSPVQWIVGGALAIVVVAAAIAVPLALLGDDATPVTEADVDLRLLSVSEGDRFYSALAAAGDELVIVGYEDLGTQVATVWSTADGGQTIEAIGQIGVVGEAYPYQVIETDSGLLAVGELFYAEARQADPLVLESEAGDEWRIVANPNLLGGDGYEYFVDVTPTGDGGYVAVRHRLGDDDRRFTTLWGSTDTRVWAPNGFTGIDEDAVVWGITRFEDGFVAVGTDGVDQPRVWLSGDRRTWTQVAVAGPLVAPQGAELLDVVAVDGGLVAVGRAELDGAGEPMVLVSDDALTWTRPELRSHEATPADEVLLTVVDTPDGLRALGQIDDQWAIWAVDLG